MDSQHHEEWNYYAVAHLALMFRVKRQTVYQWIWRYELRHVRRGRWVYVPHAEVARLVASNARLARLMGGGIPPPQPRGRGQRARRRSVANPVDNYFEKSSE